MLVTEKMAPEKKALIVIGVLSVASIMAVLETSSYVSILHGLSVGLFSSSIFYYCVVYIPERQKRKRVRIRLQEQYRSIKLDIIDLLLMLSNSQSYPYRDRENLLDQQEFKRFFKCAVSLDMDRWDAVANGLEENEYHFHELLHYLRLLNEEIRQAMIVIDIDDEEITGYLIHCSQVLSRMDIIQNDYEDIKLLCRNLLWPLYTGYSSAVGYQDTDVTQDVIDRIM